MMYHIPALLSESIEGLDIQPGGAYVDVTFGGGGHSLAILSRLDKGRLIAFDQDISTAVNVPTDPRILFLNQNFRFLRNNLIYEGVEEVDGIIADLGVSFHQFDTPERGFSFRFDTPLDMRMNSKGGKSAEDIINGYSQDELARILKEYGELNRAKVIAGAIVEARSEGRIRTTGQLAAAVSKFTPARAENKFLAQLFQSLRIEVNREIEFLKEMLVQALEVLKPGGRISIITYHSIEDRLVKNFLRSGSFSGKEDKDFYGNVSSPFRLINKKVIIPSESEIALNSRARSARLRVAEKVKIVHEN